MQFTHDPKRGVPMKLNPFLHRLQRLISWVMVPFMVAFIVSGYAYTRKIGILHRGIAFDLHTTLALPLILLVVAHIMLAARIELMRFKIKGKSVDILLFVVGIVLASAVVYVDARIPR